MLGPSQRERETCSAVSHTGLILSLSLPTTQIESRDCTRPPPPGSEPAPLSHTTSPLAISLRLEVGWRENPQCAGCENFEESSADNADNAQRLLLLIVEVR